MSPEDPLDLSGRVAIVTGAGGGIGSAIARRLSGAGASVIAHTRTSPTPDLPGPAVEVRCDLGHHEAPGLLVAAALDTFGRVDILVNNAAAQPVVALADMTDDDFAAVLDVNLDALHRCTQAVAAQLRSQAGGGVVVHIASIEGLQPAAGHAHYATSKAAVIMHARAAALEYGPDAIRVVSVSPGLIDRPGLAAAWPDGVARWHAAAPLGRLGTGDDVADACLFLVSPLARWITGVNLIVDGGVSCHPTW